MIDRSKGSSNMSEAEPGRTRGVYGISVAADLVGTGVQNLRAYEARGLLSPVRTAGGTRRYSADDLDRLPTERGNYPEFYRLLAARILDGGAQSALPLPVNPEDAVEVLKIIEAARELG